MSILKKIHSLFFILLIITLVLFGERILSKFNFNKNEAVNSIQSENYPNLDQNENQEMITASQSQKLKIPVFQYELYSKPLCSNCVQVKEFVKNLSKENQDKIKIIEVDSRENLEILTERVLICYQNPPEELETPFLFIASDNLCLKGADNIIDYFSILKSVDG